MILAVITINDIIQTGGVILALTLSIVWIARRIVNRHKGRSGKDCGTISCDNDNNACSGCPLSDNCKKH